MPDKNVDDILNEPIKIDDFTSGDLPEPGAEEDSVNPNDVDMDNDIELNDDEVDPLGDIGLGDSDFDSELENNSLDLPDEIEQPEIVAPEEQVKWTAVPQENGDIWSEHVNGFVLRARPLSAKQGSKLKYAAQLFKDQKMLEKGTIWIDSGIDPRESLQNIADRILDRLGLVNVSKMKPKPDAKEGNQNNLEMADDLGEDDDLGLGSDDDLGLDDADLEDDDLGLDDSGLEEDDLGI